MKWRCNNDSEQLLKRMATRQRKVNTECSSPNLQVGFIQRLFSPTCSNAKFIDFGETTCSQKTSLEQQLALKPPVLELDRPVSRREMAKVTQYLQARLEYLQQAAWPQQPTYQTYTQLCEKMNTLENQFREEADDQILRESYDLSAIMELTQQNEDIPSHPNLNSMANNREIGQLEERLRTRTSQLQAIRNGQEDVFLPSLSFNSQQSSFADFLRPYRQGSTIFPDVGIKQRTVSEWELELETLALEAASLKKTVQDSYETRLSFYEKQLSYAREKTAKARLRQTRIQDRREQVEKLQHQLDMRTAEYQDAKMSLVVDRQKLQQLKKENNEYSKFDQQYSYWYNLVRQQTQEYQAIMEENYQLENQISMKKQEMEYVADESGHSELLLLQHEVSDLTMEIKLLKPINNSLDDMNQQSGKLNELRSKVEHQYLRIEEKAAYIERKKRGIFNKKYLMWDRSPTHPDWEREGEGSSETTISPMNKRGLSDTLFRVSRRGSLRIRTRTIGVVTAVIFVITYLCFLVLFGLRSLL